MVRKKLSYPNFKTMRQALRETETYFSELMGKPCLIDRDDFLDWYFVNTDKFTIREALSSAIMSCFRQLAQNNPDGPIKAHEDGRVEVLPNKPLPDHMYWVITGKMPKEKLDVEESQRGKV
jgi:hypothetical protein